MIRAFSIILWIAFSNTCFAFYAYVPDAGAQTVFIVDTTTNNVLGTVSNGTSHPFSTPFCIVSSPDGLTTYVGDLGNYYLYVIDTDSNSPTFNEVTAAVAIPAPIQPVSMAITPDGKTLYVAIFEPGTIFIFDTSSLSFTGTVTGLSMSPIISDIAIYRDGTYAYATDPANGIYVIDTDPASGTYNTVVNTLTDTPATSLAFSPDGEFCYITFTSGSGGIVLVFGANPNRMNWNTVVDVITAGMYTSFLNNISIALNPEGNLLYILDTGNQCIYTADTTTYTTIQQTPVSLATMPPLVLLGVVPDGSSVYITPLLPEIFVMDPNTYAITGVTNTTSTPILAPRGVSFVSSNKIIRAFQRPNNRR